MKIILQLLGGLLILSLMAIPACAPEPEKQYTLKFAVGNMPGTPQDIAALYMKKIVEERTNGNVKVEVYSGQQLGTDREALEAVQAGTIEAVGPLAANVSAFVPVYGVLDLPFLFSSPERAYEVMQGELGDKMGAVTLEHGFVTGTWWNNGFKCFTAHFPITGPDDYIGRRIRVTGNPLLALQYELLGASPITIAFRELYTALQEGLADGEENGLVAIYNMKFYEVQQYVVLSYHSWSTMPVLLSKKWMDQLPEEYREIIMEATRASAAMQWNVNKEAEEGWVAEIRDYGCTVTELTAAQKEAFVDKLEPLYEKVGETLGLDEYDLKLLAELREEAAKEATITEFA